MIGGSQHPNEFFCFVLLWLNCGVHVDVASLCLASVKAQKYYLLELWFQLSWTYSSFGCILCKMWNSFPDNFFYLGHPNKDSNMQVNFPKKSPQKNVHKIFNQHNDNPHIRMISKVW